jgi:hypothetical protein
LPCGAAEVRKGGEGGIDRDDAVEVAEPGTRTSQRVLVEQLVPRLVVEPG